MESHHSRLGLNRHHHHCLRYPRFRHYRYQPILKHQVGRHHWHLICHHYRRRYLRLHHRNHHCHYQCSDRSLTLDIGPMYLEHHHHHRRRHKYPRLHHHHNQKDIELVKYCVWKVLCILLGIVLVLIGQFGPRNILHLHQRNLLELLNQCLDCKFLLNKRSDWIGLFPRVSQHNALHLHPHNLLKL